MTKLLIFQEEIDTYDQLSFEQLLMRRQGFLQQLFAGEKVPSNGMSTSETTEGGFALNA
ncbi:MAG: hypothetical protein R3A13_00270 [Bdellovibrionota bacterium]